MDQSPVSAGTMVRTIHDVWFGLRGRLRGVVTPPFRRTLRVNSYPAHRACEVWWWATATTADCGLSGVDLCVGKEISAARVHPQGASTRFDDNVW